MSESLCKQVRIYQPTFQLDPRKRFNVENVEKIIKRFVDSELQEVEYSEKVIPDLCLTLTENIRTALKEENYDSISTIRLLTKNTGDRVIRHIIIVTGIRSLRTKNELQETSKREAWFVGLPGIQYLLNCSIEGAINFYRSYVLLRYRIIVAVTIGQKRQQGVHMFHSFLWDQERDAFANYSFENCHIYANVVAYGVYLD